MCRWILLFLPTSIFLLSGCDKQHATVKKPDKEFRVCISEDPATLDPRKGGDAISSQLQFMLFEGLTQLNEDGSVSCAQAHEILNSFDKKKYTFLLGKTQWSNGDTVTSHDFEKAWKTILDPKFPSPNAHLLYPIKGAQQAKEGILPMDDVAIFCPDKNTLIVELEQPTPYFLQLISFCVFSPVHSSMDLKDVTDNKSQKTPLVSNGPFILSEWKHQNEVTLIKNKLYRIEEKTGIDVIYISVIPSEMTALKMYERGELDFLGHPFSSLSNEELSESQLENELHLIPAAATTFVTFNTQNKFFKNKNIRKAFSFALDRELIVKNITPFKEYCATRIIPPTLVGNKNKDLFTKHNPSLAKDLLLQGMDELEIKKEDLETLTFFYSKTEHNHKIAQVMQQQWYEVLGIMINLQALESKNLLHKLSNRDYDVALTMWRAQYCDPASILERFQYALNIKNYPGWENTAFTDCMNQSTSQNDTKRFQTLEQAELILAEDLPLLPIYHWNLSFLHKKRVTNIEFSPVGGIFFERINIDIHKYDKIEEK
ncbi:MAG: peptide ABC transporter substrate-binding protein [Chlamydiae bacterium]|nr:peptide ABC transporter substrate-binding protein [Chlamydiota bacterium]